MMTTPPDIYHQLSEKYNLPVDCIREAVNYFWRIGIKRSLENMVEPEIYVANLGSFKIKNYKLKYVIPQSYEISQRVGMHERNAEYFNLLHARLKRIDEKIREKQEEYNEFLRQNPRRFQKSPSNLGGAAEQGD